MLEYLYVEQVVEKMAENPAHFEGRTIKVHGLVVEGSIKKNKKTGDYLFKVTHGGKTIDVHFTDIPPDTFQEGGEVVLTGHFNAAADTFESEEMSAKCPSKYENEQEVDVGGGGTKILPKT